LYKQQSNSSRPVIKKGVREIPGTLGWQTGSSGRGPEFKTQSLPKKKKKKKKRKKRKKRK
jgi:hypothetical protein